MEAGSMGGGTPWGAIISSVGNLAGTLNNAAALRKKNRILTQGTRQQNRAGMEAAGTMGEFLQQLRASRPDASAERGAFNQALGAPAVSVLPTASREFQQGAAGATGAAQGYGRTMADLLARVRAPQLQRRDEAALLMDAGNALRPIQAKAQDDEFLTQLRAGMVQANPWVSLGSNLLQQGGKYASSQGY